LFFFFAIVCLWLNKHRNGGICFNGAISQPQPDEPIASSLTSPIAQYGMSTDEGPVTCCLRKLRFETLTDSPPWVKRWK
jgi:hypothetical protein